MHTFPEIGAWYLNTDSGEMFEVVALDESEGEIQLQYFDGEINQLDPESWASLPLAMIPPPEDWSGPFEIEASEVDESDPIHLEEKEGEEGLLH